MQTAHAHSMLITGASGRLGRLLKQAMRQLLPEFPVYFLSRSTGFDVTWSPENPMDRLPRCQTIVGLWGRTSGSETELSINSELATTSQRIANACGASKVFHFSSAAVYGPGVQLNEDSPFAPVNLYGESKVKMERTVREFPPDNGVSHCCLRLANVIGADSLSPALKGDRPAVIDQFPDGRGPRRSYIGAGDLARILARLSALPAAELPPALNIAAPQAQAMDALISAAKKPFKWRPAPNDALAEVSLDTTRLMRLLPDFATIETESKLIAEWLSLEKSP